MPDAGQHVVDRRVGRIQVMHIAGGDQAQVEAMGQRGQPGVQAAVAALVMALQFEEEVSAAKDRGEALRDARRPFRVSFEQRAGDLAAPAA